MLILVPLATCVLTALWLWRVGGSWGRAVMLTAVCAGLGVAVSTEALDLLDVAINRSSVLACWVIPLIVAVVGLVCTFLATPRSREPRKPMTLVETVLAGLVCLVMVLTLATAISSVPNNWDSMTYHLPRVMHWWQNGSIEHYPTPITRQLYQPPLAEFGLLHIFALTGADRGLNLLQWSALCVSLVAVASITRSMGGSRASQLLAALLAATIPSVALQASNT